MGSPDDLEPRVSALESQAREVRQDLADTRALASGADRDVSALATRTDADRRLMTALRETQVEHGQRLGRLEDVVRAGFTAVLARLGALEAGQTSLLGGQASLEGRQANLESRQANLESRVEAGFASLDGRQSRVEAGLASLDGRQSRVEAGLASLDGRQSRVEAGLASLDGRQSRLEAGQSRLEEGQAMIIDLLRRRNGHDEGPPASAE